MHGTELMSYVPQSQELGQQFFVQHAQISTNLSSISIPIVSPELRIRACTMNVLYHGCGIGPLKAPHDTLFIYHSTTTTVKRARNVLVWPIISTGILPVSIYVRFYYKVRYEFFGTSAPLFAPAHVS